MRKEVVIGKINIVNWEDLANLLVIFSKIKLGELFKSLKLELKPGKDMAGLKEALKEARENSDAQAATVKTERVLEEFLEDPFRA